MHRFEPPSRFPFITQRYNLACGSGSGKFDMIEIGFFAQYSVYRFDASDCPTELECNQSDYLGLRIQFCRLTF